MPTIVVNQPLDRAFSKIYRLLRTYRYHRYSWSVAVAEAQEGIIEADMDFSVPFDFVPRERLTSGDGMAIGWMSYNGGNMPDAKGYLAFHAQFEPVAGGDATEVTYSFSDFEGNKYGGFCADEMATIFNAKISEALAAGTPSGGQYPITFFDNSAP